MPTVDDVFDQPHELVTWNCSSYHSSEQFWEMMRWSVVWRMRLI